MKLIMFDVDGTLTDSNKVDAACFVVALKEAFNIDVADIDWSVFKYVSDEGLSTEIFERTYHRTPAREDLDRTKNSYMNCLKSEIKKSGECCREIPGAVSILRQLKSKPDVALSIATGCWLESAELKLKTAGFDLDGIPIATSSDSMERTRIMQLSLERAASAYGIETFEKITYVGDGVWDANASKKLGYHFIGVGDGTNKQKLMDAGAKTIISDFRDFGMFMNLLKQ